LSQDENAPDLKITPLAAEFNEISDGTLKALQDNPPETLHHYTTSEGLLGIVSRPSSGIRASDCPSVLS
jgi:hypothetical protein